MIPWRIATFSCLLQGHVFRWIILNRSVKRWSPVVAPHFLGFILITLEMGFYFCFFFPLKMLSIHYYNWNNWKLNLIVLRKTVLCEKWSLMSSIGYPKIWNTLSFNLCETPFLICIQTRFLFLLLWSSIYFSCVSIWCKLTSNWNSGY